MAFHFPLDHRMIRNDPNMVIYKSIDDQTEGEFGIPALRAVPPPTVMVAPIHEDVLALNILILQGDQIAYHQCSLHQRSQEEPPTDFLETESDDEDLEQANEAYSRIWLSGEVINRNVATVGSLDNLGTAVELEFGPVLEPHSPASSAKYSESL